MQAPGQRCVCRVHTWHRITCSVAVHPACIHAMRGGEAWLPSLSDGAPVQVLHHTHGRSWACPQSRWAGLGAMRHAMQDAHARLCVTCPPSHTMSHSITTTGPYPLPLGWRRQHVHMHLSLAWAWEGGACLGHGWYGGGGGEVVAHYAQAHARNATMCRPAGAL